MGTLPGCGSPRQRGQWASNPLKLSRELNFTLTSQASAVILLCNRRGRKGASVPWPPPLPVFSKKNQLPVLFVWDGALEVCVDVP